MADLRISRRTLQRWLDDLDIESLEFEDHLKVFLTLPHIQKMREYKQFMRSGNQSLITRYRDANRTGNTRRMDRLRKDLKEFIANSPNKEFTDEFSTAGFK